MISLLALVFFVFGSIVGSFLNVVVIRYNTGRSFGGRSACLSCQRELRPRELIPILSFLTLRGQCLTCKTKISVQYPLVELVTGLVFAGLFFKFQTLFFTSVFLFSVLFAFDAVLFCLLIVIAVYDLRHKIIPDPFVFVFSALAFLGLFFFSGASFEPRFPGFLELISGPLIAAPFAAIWLFSRGAWMGLGDAKLTLGLGYFLGLSAALSGLFIAFLSGAVVGIILLLFRRYGLKSEVPFAPFLVLGALAAFLLDLHLFPI
jgi:leader peptidase (prepilin peptidase) / N-methyltransferase